MKHFKSHCANQHGILRESCAQVIEAIKRINFDTPVDAAFALLELDEIEYQIQELLETALYLVENTEHNRSSTTLFDKKVALAKASMERVNLVCEHMLEKKLAAECLANDRDAKWNDEVAMTDDLAKFVTEQRRLRSTAREILYHAQQAAMELVNNQPKH